jgi:hypothetical protein
MALKENYKDDILDVSVNTKRKYQMENNGDGTVSFTDVTEYTQQGDSFGASDMNATNGKVNTLESDIGEINDNLNGFTFYSAGEIDLVASVADDSYYTDANGKYVLADSPTGESLIDDITYKSLTSNEDLRGKVGTDTAVEFGGKTMKVKEILVLQNIAPSNTKIGFATISNLTTKVINFSRAFLASHSITNLEGEYFSVSVGSNTTIKAKKAGKYAIYKLTSNGATGLHENYAYVGTYDKSVNENIINDSWDSSLEYYVEALE